jgi:malonate transporter
LLVIKLVVMPLVAWWLATAVFDLPRVEAGIAILFAALPAGANAYLFAERQGHGEAAVSGAIAAGTALSIVTLTVVLALLA